MNKLPLKYQGVTQGEWKAVGSALCAGHFVTSNNLGFHVGIADLCCNTDAPSRFGLDNTEEFVALSREQIAANSELMADSKRLAGAVVELREAITQIHKSCALGSSEDLVCREALAATKEWAA